MNAINPDVSGVEQETEICISCLQPNEPGLHFCPHCGTPLTCYAATGPFESMFAEGDFLRKATADKRWGKPVRIFLIGLLGWVLVSLLLGWFVPG